MFKNKWAEECNGCNGCHGKGKKTKWPTDWIPYEKDVIPVSEIKDGLTCATFISDQVVEVEEGFDKVMKVKDILAKHKLTKGYLVTVDYHD